MEINKNKLVSIITSSYNSEKTIMDTVDSILNQTITPTEYILVDGGSSDKTVEMVAAREKEFIEKNIALQIVSEKDDGIADAWNKGLDMAKGDVIGLLNSDDYYDSKAIEKVLKTINLNKMELTYGICNRINDEGKIVATLDKAFNPQRVYLNFGFSHTTCFVTRVTYNAVGIFDKNFQIGLDVDFLLRCLKKGVKFKRAGNITYMRTGGVSLKFKKEAIDEHKKALIKNGFNPVLAKLAAMLKKNMF